MSEEPSKRAGESGRKTVVLCTSSAPFGMSELWFQAEVEELEKTHDVVLVPVWPRGLQQWWPGQLATKGGRPRGNNLRALRTLIFSKESRRSLLECRNTYNWRTSGKCAIAVFGAIKWSIVLSGRKHDICHVHATSVAAPSAAAVALAEQFQVSSSATAHRNDILRHASSTTLRRLDLIRAISSRAQFLLDERDVHSDVIRFGAISSVAPAIPPHQGTRINCVSIGHLTQRKGHDRSLRMVRALIDSGVDIRLDIFGAGNLEHELKIQSMRLNVDEFVTFRGEIPHLKLLDELSSERWNVLLHSSIQSGELDEGIPVAILEAASFGLALVASDSGATREFIRDGRNGLLISATDETLAVNMGVSALRELSVNPERRGHLAEQAHVDVQEFTASRSVSAMRDALNSLHNDDSR